MASAQAMSVSVSEGIPKKIKDKVFLNEDREIVEFKLLGLDEKQKKYRTENIPGEDYLYDPSDRKTYPIKYMGKSITGFGGSVIDYAEPIWFESGAFSRIMCNLNTAHGRRLYEYLCMSNYNKSNPLRDKNVQPKFFMVDSNKEAEEALVSERQIIKVKEMVYNLSTEELRWLADHYYIDSRDKVAVLRKKMLERANTDAINMEPIIESVKEEGEYFSIVVRAKRHNIIRVNHKMGRWSWVETHKMIVAYNPDIGSEENDRRLARYLASDEGGKVYNTILKKLESVGHQYKV